MPDCDAIRQLVQAYLDDALGPPERARVEAHAADCAACGRLVATYRQLFAALDAPALPDAPAALTATVMRRIAAERAPGQSWQTWIAAAAMVSIALGAALFVWGEAPFADWLNVSALSVPEIGQVQFGVVEALTGAIEQLGGLEPELPSVSYVPLLAAAALLALCASAALAYQWRGLAEPDHCPGTRMAR